MQYPNLCDEVMLTTPVIQRPSFSDPGVIKSLDDSEILGLSGLSFPIGVIRSTDNYNNYHSSYLRTSWENRNLIVPKNFELVLNVNRIWGYIYNNDLTQLNGFNRDYSFRTGRPMSRIRIPDN